LPLITQKFPPGQKPFFTWDDSSDILLPRGSSAATRPPFFESQNSQNRVAKTFQYFTFGSPGNETKMKHGLPIKSDDRATSWAVNS
jgi:hypothetical protein